MAQDKTHGKHQDPIPKTVKKIKRAIKGSDAFVTFFKLKKLVIPTDLALDGPTTKKLYEFMKSFKSAHIVFDTDFDDFMFKFLMVLQSDSLEMHLGCLSLLQNNVKLEEIREKFSYSKIFSIFKSNIKNTFIDGIDPSNLALLIRLLDNNKLVFKHLVSIIERLNLFLEKSIVDKSIIECCVVLTSFGNGCFEMFDDLFVASVLGYLVEFLYQPKTFFFIESKPCQKIIDAIIFLSSGLSKYPKLSVNLKKISSNLLNECVFKINEYKKSTVYEEVMVVVCMTSCLTPLFELFKSSGNNYKSVLHPNLLSFMVFDRNNKSNNEVNDKILKVNFDRPFKSHYNSHYQLLRDTFLMNKYRFIDTFMIESFDRIEFLNDLSKIENPKLIFLVLKNLKSKLDWSDLIVFACNAPIKDSYVSLIFDEEFVKYSEHSIFLDLFLTNVQNNEKILVYCTNCAIKADLVFLLPKLYLIDLEKNTLVAKKRRNMIIEYLNGAGECIFLKGMSSRDISVKNMKEVIVDIEKITLNDDTVEKYKNIKIKEVKPSENKNNIEEALIFEFDLESVALDIQIQEFTSIFANQVSCLHMNLVPLLIVIASKKIDKNTLEKLIKKIISLLNGINDLEEPCNISIICIISILCRIYKNEFFLSNELKNIVELLIAVISLRTGNYPEEYASLVKERGFSIVVSESPKNVALVSQLYKFEDSTNAYIKEYLKIMWLITDREWIAELINNERK